MKGTEDIIENLLSVIIRELVTNPDALKIEKSISSRNNEFVSYKVIVDDNDMCRVIGKHGRIAKSIRNVARAAAIKNDMKISVEIG